MKTIYKAPWRIKRDKARLAARKQRADKLRSEMSVISDTEAAYLAGLIDGEGCIFINKVRTRNSSKGSKRGLSYRSGVAIAMTRLIVLKWVKRIVKAGKIRVYRKPAKNRHQAWRWSLWSLQASALLKRLLPFFVLKRRHAENQIALQSVMYLTGPHGFSNKDWNERERFFQKAKKLNKRGS